MLLSWSTIERQTRPSRRRELAVHHVASISAGTGTMMPQIFATSTFAHGNHGGFDDSRSGNPNIRILWRALTAIEHCDRVRPSLK